MIKVASSQFASSKNNFDGNMNKALEIAKKASDENVNILLFQELFQSEYFCSTKNEDFFENRDSNAYFSLSLQIQ